MLLWNTQQDVKIIGQRSIFSICLEYIGGSKATFWIPINYFHYVHLLCENLKLTHDKIVQTVVTKYMQTSVNVNISKH